MPADDAPASPCMGLCRIGGNGWCEGCWRTLDEIAGWGAMSSDEKRAVLARGVERRSLARP